MDVLNTAMSEDITLGAVLGEGASAVTFQAEHRTHGVVCVKQFKSSANAEDLDRINREMAVLQRLDHPNIPSVLGAYQQQVNGRWLLHIVQELVDGEDLDQWVSRQRPSLLTIQQILAEVLGILVYLHEHHPPIIHRDIKPSNLMRRADGKIVLIDFGQAVEDIHRTFGQTMVTGTLGYQSQEQILGEATKKSDVYSVGVVAVELFTGLKPHTMLEGQNLRWERKCRGLPLPVQEWLDGLLRPDPTQRFSAGDALAQLQAMGDVFVTVQRAGNAMETDHAVSENFLELLDNEIDSKRRLAEAAQDAAYRRRIEEERQNDLDAALWMEMLASWKRLLKTVADGRVSADKGIAAYRQAFTQPVEAAMARRTEGVVDARVCMLWELVKEDDPLNRSDATDVYWNWVGNSPLRKENEKLESTEKRINQAETLKWKLQSELTGLSWWGRLWQQSDLESNIRQQSQQIDTLRQSYQQSMRVFEGLLSFWSCSGVIAIPALDSFVFLSSQAMMLIPKGDFMMGALENDGDAYSDEKPRHKVTLTRDFLMCKYPVTQALWESVMGSNPSSFKGENRPVECVSWFDVVEFCNKLSRRAGLEPVYTINGENVTCNWNATGYRLPTEAEWEYSARSGQRFKYAGSDNVDEVAWYKENSGRKTHPVGQKKPNGFGLYDMSGNVWEWVWDKVELVGRSMPPYASNSQTDPTGPDSGPFRVYRGGSWDTSAGNTRVSYRNFFGPTFRYYYLGFRLSRSVQ